MKTEYKGHTIELVPDHYAESPREWDNYSTMYCFHRRYALGDENPYTSDMFNGWGEMRRRIERDHNVYIIKPLYIYDHGGITISTSSFYGRVPQGHARFDSGQVGWVFVDTEWMRKMQGWQRITDERRKLLEKYMDSEIELYDQYLRGNTYGWKILKNGEEVDSCYGYIGDTDDIIEQAKSHIK